MLSWSSRAAILDVSEASRFSNKRTYCGWLAVLTMKATTATVTNAASTTLTRALIESRRQA